MSYCLGIYFFAMLLVTMSWDYFIIFIRVSNKADVSNLYEDAMRDAPDDLSAAIAEPTTQWVLNIKANVQTCI